MFVGGGGEGVIHTHTHTHTEPFGPSRILDLLTHCPKSTPLSCSNSSPWCALFGRLVCLGHQCCPRHPTLTKPQLSLPLPNHCTKYILPTWHFFCLPGSVAHLHAYRRKTRLSKKKAVHGWRPARSSVLCASQAATLCHHAPPPVLHKARPLLHPLTHSKQAQLSSQNVVCFVFICQCLNFNSSGSIHLLAFRQRIR